MEMIEAQMAAWEDEEIRHWFSEICEMETVGCAGAAGEWFIDADGVTRCKRCNMPAA